MEGICSSEKSADFQRTTLFYILEDVASPLKEFGPVCLKVPFISETAQISDEYTTYSFRAEV
jgi:hypothetical protein